ncbi:M18 family aminopeptidase [bacterium]|nr:M18 family aminopeptidase [bacterium]
MRNGFIDFLNSSPTQYHAAEEIEKKLKDSGFIYLEESSRWSLQKGAKYYIKRDNSSIAAWINTTDSVEDGGFKIAAAHTDSPSLKIKWGSETVQNGCIKATTEIYGGPIISTWLDRALKIAGRVVYESTDGIKTKSIVLKTKVVIPNLAIHLNREINEGFSYNPQNHLSVILSTQPYDGSILKKWISEEYEIDSESILDADLFLYNSEGAILMGEESNTILSSRLDNLESCHAILEALIASEASRKVKVALFFDNEEIGSQTRMGADSQYLTMLLQRITFGNSENIEAYHIASAKSIMISTDMAHAVHPNFADKHDPKYQPLLGNGPVIKYSASFRYATTAETASYFVSVCKKASVPSQKILNRSDIRSGSTVGPMSSALSGIATVDIGNPMWGMHSIMETANLLDHQYLIEALKTHFSDF